MCPCVRYVCMCACLCVFGWVSVCICPCVRRARALVRVHARKRLLRHLSSEARATLLLEPCVRQSSTLLLSSVLDKAAAQVGPDGRNRGASYFESNPSTAG